MCIRIIRNKKPSRALRRDCLYPLARPSVLVSHAPSVTSRFWLARRRPSPLFRPAAGLRSPPATGACRPTLARPPVRLRKPRAWRDIFTIRLLSQGFVLSQSTCHLVIYRFYGRRTRPAEARTSASKRVTLYSTWWPSALTTRPHGQVVVMVV